MSLSIKEELGRFVAELKIGNPQMTWDEIAEGARAKFSDGPGLSLTENAIKKRYIDWLRESEGSESQIMRRQR